MYIYRTPLRSTSDIGLQNDIIAPVANVLLRGLDPATLSRLRAQARRRGVSVNRLIVETLRREHAAGETFDDLDALAGRWSKSDADRFAAALAPLSEIDAGLWAQEPKGVYRVKRAGRRPRR